MSSNSIRSYAASRILAIKSFYLALAAALSPSVPLAGFILKCGIIDAQNQPTADAFDDCVNKAYRAYRSCYRTVLMRLLRGDASDAAREEFKAKFCRSEQSKIQFIGVWDTVDAVGMPFHVSDLINAVFYRFMWTRRIMP